MGPTGRCRGERGEMDGDGQVARRLMMAAVLMAEKSRRAGCCWSRGQTTQGCMRASRRASQRASRQAVTVMRWGRLVAGSGRRCWRDARRAASAARSRGPCVPGGRTGSYARRISRSHTPPPQPTHRRRHPTALADGRTLWQSDIS